ncbi:hypothetical protein Y032_0419g1131 [Ancylostoma ceylanicum]|uniref:Uncharacterized protein n=1 Tax=Ancylostoma ceylanicum TaxID=53326 RepID=A0A016X1J1_9BILA|nr:hypothetical protein Y032_0419g1131 [Ancylostoma ceylanicum]
MSGPKAADHSKQFEKTIDKQVKWDRLEEWSDNNISQVFKQAEPGDLIELKITVDFKNAPGYTTAEEKKELMNRITQLEGHYMPK